MSSVEIGDLIRALGRARATFVAHVGPGATTTTIPLADLDLGSANLSGNLALLDAGALGPATPPTIATISSNTAASLTVPALSAAPAEGSTVWLFSVATIQASASENIAQWSGTAVAAPQGDNADGVAPVTSGVPLILARLTAWTGSAWSRLKLAVSGSLQVRDDATSATSAAAPSVATLVGGTNGTDLYPLLTDATGKPQVTVATALPAGTNTIGAVNQGTSPWITNATLAGTLNDASGSTSSTAGTSTVALAAGSVTRYLFIQNGSTTSGDNLWVNFGAAATEGAGSILIGPGQALVFENTFVPNTSVNVISNVASLPYTIKYA